MASFNRAIKLLAAKLGIGDEDKVLNKAAEFERLLQVKSTAGSNMTDTSKTVICLDFAAALFGVDLDTKMTIKYSGLKGPAYSNCKKIVQNLLELNREKLTVTYLCLSLQCTGVQYLAEKIFEEYSIQKPEIDLSLPQYTCMAVYQACKLNKVKVAKSKLIEKSRLKPGQWAKLDADWAKVVNEKFTGVKKKGQPQKDAEKIINGTEKMDTEGQSPIKDVAEPEIEPYEDWKKRMLDIANRELKELQEQVRKEDKSTKSIEKKILQVEFTSPRRSPRKTPQKFSPYKSLKPAGNGIRLLFPKDV